MPEAIEDIIMTYVMDLQTHDKFENLFQVFMNRFERLYAPIAAGLMDYEAFDAPVMWPDIHLRFRRAQILFNQFTLKAQRFAIDPGYWIYRALSEIQWCGVCITVLKVRKVYSMFQFDKIRANYENMSPNITMSPNGFIMISVN